MQLPNVVIKDGDIGKARTNVGLKVAEFPRVVEFFEGYMEELPYVGKKSEDTFLAFADSLLLQTKKR